MKQCTRCHNHKDDSEFFFRNKEKRILHSYCKECKREIDKEFYINSDSRKTKMRSNAIDAIKRNKDFVNSIKKDSECSKCGDKRFYVLDFHHLKEKEYTISELVKRGGSLNIIEKEIDKCILLCANCHREEHYLNGTVAPM